MDIYSFLYIWQIILCAGVTAILLVLTICLFLLVVDKVCVTLAINTEIYSTNAPKQLD